MFRAATRDALDLDFASGMVTNCSFIDCGNDAIDVSGGAVDVGRTVISGAGDKGVSAGEASIVALNAVTITRAAVGVACKDGSQVQVEGIRVSDSEVGYAVYRKKPEFGAAQMMVTGSDLNGVKIPYMVEERSVLTIDGKRIEALYEDVGAMLVGAGNGGS